MKGDNTMKLTDGKKTIEIQMKVWDKYNGGYGPDWSRDFFDAGCLPHDEETEVYTVQDVDYCIEQANEWANEDENNDVFVEEL